MRDRIYDIVIVVLLVAVLGLVISGDFTPETRVVSAQNFGTNYAWVDTQTTTTTAIDSHFTVKWEQVTIRSDTSDMLIRIGSPDTSSWSSREWFKLKAGEALSFGPATKLVRLEWKTSSGTDVMSFIGYKRSPQF